MFSDLLHHARILIVDDELANVCLLEKILSREGYKNISVTTDPRHVMTLFADEEPDLILLDLHMPHVTGYELLDSLGEAIPAKSFLPIIVLTADATPAARQQALAGGASDFVCKPFDNLEVALRIKNALRARFLHRELENRNEVLEERVRDRTEMLQATIIDLREAQKQVVQQERLRALGMMAAGIVHDFNNVLSIIAGYGELLLTAGPSDKERISTQTYLQTIISAAQDGAQIVKRLARFQRPPSDADLRRPVSLMQLIDQAVALSMQKWKDAAVEVFTELQEAPDIAGDPVELRELLINLIFNAVDAMPDGGAITLRTHAASREVLLEVGDTGTGMTEEVRQRCLEPFFSTKGENGSGLGLAMIYGIVQRHEGSLNIQTQLGVGTKFQIRFPIDQAGEVDEEVFALECDQPQELLTAG